MKSHYICFHLGNRKLNLDYFPAMWNPSEALYPVGRSFQAALATWLSGVKRLADIRLPSP